jgi:hypothetical protein
MIPSRFGASRAYTVGIIVWCLVVGSLYAPIKQLQLTAQVFSPAAPSGAAILITGRVTVALCVLLALTALMIREHRHAETAGRP